MPDYGQYFVSNPAWQQPNKEFPDPSSTAHRTLTNYALLKKYTDSSPFKTVSFLQYADNTVPGDKLPEASDQLPEGAFVNSLEKPLPMIRHPIDHHLGVVRRVPGVDCRNNFLSRLKGDPETASLVFDLVK